MELRAGSRDQGVEREQGAGNMDIPHPVSMSRWDYDTVFYRVFCITLLAVAFTFTVILTNVFVDIDGLLSKKDKDKTPKQASIQNHASVQKDILDVLNGNLLDDKSEDVYEDKDYQDSNDLYRSKRSLDHDLFLIKDQKVKKILTNRLASLLDKLDEEESNKHYIETVDVKNHKKGNAENTFDNHYKGKTEKEKPHLVYEDEKIKREVDAIKQAEDNKLKIKETDAKPFDEEDELLHLAMHNTILQGIIGNMNLDEVYKRVANLVKNFEFEHSKVKETKPEHKQKFHEYIVDETTTKNKADTENVKRSMTSENVVENKIVTTTTTAKPKAHNVMIKTVIDITTLTNDKTNKENDLNTMDKMNGIIKLIYNGKSIKFKRTDDDTSTSTRSCSDNPIVKTTAMPAQEHTDPTEKPSDSEGDIYVPTPKFYKKVIQDYMKKIQSDTDSNEPEKIYTRKRLKRHIKIRYDQKTTEKPKVHLKNNEDDELFVEIETHFDSKGSKGEKKKKMIRELIEKIQNALHSDKEAKKKKQKHWHVKKRMQDPLGRNTAAAFINKLMLPLETMTHRHLDPISKSVPENEDMPIVTDDFGHSNWQRKYGSPPFFGKSINSAEMGTVETEYDKVMTHNGIPQRLQKPLNTGMSDELLLQDTNLVDLGKIKLLVKDIAGSGFSIGFNQYTDAPPDPETMKVFMGLENVIQKYHQNYDADTDQDLQKNIGDSPDEVPNINTEEFLENPDMQMNRADPHLIERRSINNRHNPDHHLNEYNALLNSKLLPYDNYRDIYEPNNKKSTLKVKQTKNNKKKTKIPSLVENMLNKRLKPAEILSIANLFQRRKRSMNVKKISNIRMNKKISRYLNTNMMATKSVFLNKKRNKRQIDKIRIVARDLPNQHLRRDSAEEDIFVVSDEKIFADRALVREVDMPDMDGNDKHAEEHFDGIAPQKEEEPYDMMAPQQKVNDEIYDTSNPYVYDALAKPYESYNNEFSRRARHNSLMSKYPHIIMEEMTKSKEEIIQDSPFTYQKNYVESSTTTALVPTFEEASPNAQDIADMILPPKDNSNYKVTVKIRPKNVTGMSGYKEVHTSINKSYNKNGLTYTSLVNVSQLSKIEKTNKNSTIPPPRPKKYTDLSHLRHQQQLIKTLIQQHKQRIDQQLQQLNTEREKLETMNVDTTEILPDKLVDVTHAMDPKKTIQLTPDEVNLVMAEEMNNTLETTTPILVTQMAITETTTITTTTTEYTPPKTIDSDKEKIINTIERNENITNKILKKIDQNTEVLKDFLGILVNKIDGNSRRAGTDQLNIQSNTKIEETAENNEPFIQYQPKPQMVMNNMPYTFADYQQSIPNMFFRNAMMHSNNTMGIPFVYAYQQPYNVVTNKDTPPVASVVYHGHIHTNTLNNRDGSYYYKPLENKTSARNVTVANISSNINNMPINNIPVHNMQVNNMPVNNIPVRNIQVNNMPANNAPVNNAPANNIPVINKNKVLMENPKPKKPKTNVFWKPKPGEKMLHDFVIKNNTRFFLDDSVNDFKLLQAAMIKHDKSMYGLAVPGNYTKM